jgi:cyclophilin family peptidyl-prolyl cis-trans isomerase
MSKNDSSSSRSSKPQWTDSMPCDKLAKMCQQLCHTKNRAGKRLFLVALFLATVLAFSACGSEATVQPPTIEGGVMQWSSQPPMIIDKNKEYTATIKTNVGEIKAQLFPQDAPVTVNNFVFLARNGFYDGVKFHRVVKGFVIQGGDPLGNGTGGPGYKFADEKITRDYALGTLAMANSGPNTNGSQFFITLADLSGRLPKKYTIFGQVTEGLDVVKKIEAVPVKASPGGELSSPTADVHIDTVTIEEK